MLAMIGPQTSTKLVGGHGTSVNHVLAMAFDDQNDGQRPRPESLIRTKSWWTTSGRM
jgi:hypothetical protein